MAQDQPPRPLSPQSTIPTLGISGSPQIEGSTTNTGKGGFVIDGVVHDFIVGDPSAEGETFGQVDKGDIRVNNEVKDISKGTRVTLSQYLKNVTSENRFPIKGEYTEIKLTDNGIPQALPWTSSNDIQFVERSGASGVSPNKSGDPATRLSFLTKGKKSLKKNNNSIDILNPSNVPAEVDFSDKEFDGNSLLRSVIDETRLPGVITGYRSAVLAINRFSDVLLSAPEITGNTNDIKPSNDFNPKLHHPRYGDVSMNRLAQVGVALSLRASQELNAASDGNNPTGGIQEAATLLPSANQLGAKRIDSMVLEARDVLETLTSEEVPKGDFTNISDLSWGSLNNVDDQYSGILALGMIPLSVALTAAIVLLFEALGLLFGLIKESSGSARNVSGRYVLGRNHVIKTADPNSFPPGFNLPPDIGALLGLRGTIFPYKTCVQKGTTVFFGIDDSSGIIGSIIGSVKSASETPQFNSIVARTIIRSSLSVVDAFKKTFKSSNLISGIKNILNIIDVIRSSKLISAANVFAMIGDLTLTDPGDLIEATDSISEEPIKKSKMDSLGDGTTHASVSKNRLRNSVKLAWSSNRSPAMYLIPESIVTMGIADNALGGFKGAISLFDADDKSKTSVKILKKGEAADNGSRILRNDVKADYDVKRFEAALDSEYVPFSFHDLRTNEIISFHAFLTSLSDDYTANYETGDSYGRVDQVKIYKNTNRRVGMSFYVVATSEHDFDDMWVKINKLTTLLYPQYTRGRMLSNKEKGIQFVQPFSQLIGSNPLIRIRLGDLFRSNYSRFALARLFGLGGPDTIKLGDKIEIKSFSGAETKVSNIKKKLSDPSKDMTFTMGSDQWPKADKGGIGISLSPPIPLIAGTGGPKQSPTLSIDMNDAEYIFLKAVKVDGLKANVKVKLASAFELTDPNGPWAYDDTTATNIANALHEKYENDDDKSRKIVGDGLYQIPLAFLKPTKKTLDDLIKKEFGTEIKDIEKISDFLSVEKNALVKSFNSVQGKGLAGVIESMNFDWYDKVTWDTRNGSTAPKMCKVTISFAPIHDISPGIDHMGYNRAPIYPVGSAMQMGSDGGEKGSLNAI